MCRPIVLSVLLGGLAVSAPALAQTGSVPQRTDDNLIVAAYNIQWLGQKTHDLDKLATVIQHFDVCGIIEIKAESALPALVEALETKTGKDWGYTFGTRTHRPNARYHTHRYHEAYGAVWRRDRVQLGDGLIGGIWDLEEAFRNDPYVVSFKRRGFDFSLILVHTRWSDDEEGSRANEVAMLAHQLDWMQSFLPEEDILLAGDFNYSGTAEVMVKLAQNADLFQLDANPKSTFKTDGSAYANSYDHIYAPNGRTEHEWLNICETLDVTELVYGGMSPAEMLAAREELSDHLPVFAVFDVSKSDDD